MFFLMVAFAILLAPLGYEPLGEGNSLVKLVNDANGEHLVVFYTVCNPQIRLFKKNIHSSRAAAVDVTRVFYSVISA